MNTVIALLRSRWASVPQADSLEPDELSCVFVTPRFRASSHVLAFVLAQGRRDPVMVAKIPRLASDTGQLDREVDNLKKAEALGGEIASAIPKVLFYEDYGGHRLLIETALPGRPLKASQIRRTPDRMIERVLDWLVEFHLASARSCREVAGWYGQSVEPTLTQLERLFREGSPESIWVHETRQLLEPLRQARFPLVFEHGDFSSPNILLADNGSIGVVDWELAESVGLPAIDAFFFLNFAAFSKHRARNNSQYVDAFKGAFFGAKGWALPQLRSYSQRLGLETALLQPLFVFCWARYVANLAVRLQKHDDANASVGDNSMTWLRNNRYFRLWEFALKHSDDLDFDLKRSSK